MQHYDAGSAPVQALAMLRGVSSTHPAPGEEEQGMWGMGEVGQGEGQHRVGAVQGSHGTAAAGGSFHPSSTAELICR